MSYLLDTNACIAIINGDPEAVRHRLAREMALGSQVFIPTVTVFELWFGVAKSTRMQENTVLLETFLSSNLAPLSFDSLDARTASEIRFFLQRQGRPIGAYDLLIAAQALRRDLTLVSANEREFRRVPGLHCQNWA